MNCKVTESRELFYNDSKIKKSIRILTQPSCYSTELNFKALIAK